MSPRSPDPGLENDPLWYKDAIIYELHVRAFMDSNGDGIGDFRGLTEKLDYLQDLGVTALWLLPFYPSPLKDDGYDISDYTGVNEMYGQIRDFQVLLREAHRRGLRVITELVINHTSDHHAWFQRSRRAKPGSIWRDFYVWSDTPDRYKEARIIFKDFESSNWTWDSVAGAYYWHRFYSQQPDLNFDAPQVRRAMIRLVDFWLGMGVDGLRLDAVPYLFEREGTNCENLPETHEYLQQLRAHVDAKFTNRMLLGEANQWPEDAARYFGDDDECNMAFHFPLMPRLFMAIRMEDRFPIIDILRQTPAIGEASQWALFLRNHDELTLEMVTDEDRDYMYRAYAHDAEARINLGIRRRLAPLLGKDRRKIELMNGLLLALPGTPVLYYGDEIGMGDNIYLGDRDGVRTPMQWSSDRNAGFSRANPQKLYLPVIIDPEYHSETVNVEAQQNNPHSQLWWIKRLIALRKRYQAFGRGSIEFLLPENNKILAFVRRYGDECILVVANMSRFVQAVELDLSGYRGAVPVELFGHTRFPAAGDAPYFLTLGPHAFYWFSLEQQAEPAALVSGPKDASRLATLAVSGNWENLFQGRAKTALEAVLPDYLRACRWFGGKGRRIQASRVVEAIPLGRSGSRPHAIIVQVRVEYVEGEPETYVLPMTLARGAQAEIVLRDLPQAVIAQVSLKGEAEPAILHDASWDEKFCEMLLGAIARRRVFTGKNGAITGIPTRAYRKIAAGGDGGPLRPVVLQGEQSNTSIVFGDRFILKIFRRVENGLNPDLEISAFLTERNRFAQTPQLAGLLEYRAGRAQPMMLASLTGYVPNQGDAWRYTCDELGRYFERVLSMGTAMADLPDPERDLLTMTEDYQAPSPLAEQTIGAYLGDARLLGQRTAELHLALASESEDATFAAEPFTSFYQQSIYQSVRRTVSQTFALLRARINTLSAEARVDAERISGAEREILERLQSTLLNRKIEMLRIRHHGDYHLGQVLHTGDDFVIIDFEGEPSRSLSERRMKRSPLRDGAGMLRSFHYAVYSTLSDATSGVLRPEDVISLEPWARFWYQEIAATFLGSYLDTVRKGKLLPDDRDNLRALLDVFLLEKAVYELGYELNSRPDWVHVPLRGILQLLERPT